MTKLLNVRLTVYTFHVQTLLRHDCSISSLYSAQPETESPSNHSHIGEEQPQSVTYALQPQTQPNIDFE